MKRWHREAGARRWDEHGRRRGAQKWGTRRSGLKGPQKACDLVYRLQTGGLSGRGGLLIPGHSASSTKAQWGAGGQWGGAQTQQWLRGLVGLGQPFCGGGRACGAWEGQPAVPSPLRDGPGDGGGLPAGSLRWRGPAVRESVGPGLAGGLDRKSAKRLGRDSMQAPSETCRSGPAP